MERRLIISDNCSLLADQSAAIDHALNEAENLRIMLLSTHEPPQGPSIPSKACDVLSRNNIPIKRVAVSNRWGFTSSRDLVAAINNFSPATVDLFCLHPFSWLVPLARCRIRRATVHLQQSLRNVMRIAIAESLPLMPHIDWQVPSPEIAQELIESGIPQTNVSVKSPAYRFEFESRYVNSETGNREVVLREFGLPSHAKLVTTVTYLQPNNGLRDLIWACEILKGVRDDVHLCIIGDVDPRKRDFIRELQLFVRKTLLKNQVHFLGWSTKAADLIGVSSLYCEASAKLPKSKGLCFARFMQIPTIVPDSDFNQQHFKNAVDCLMYRKQARNELARSMYRLLEDVELAKSISINARLNDKQNEGTQVNSKSIKANSKVTAA
ncbi:MAG TPA: glycosyltransferase [Pirellulaceae bacterium]|nr:glycosyltransferase [Pirellulaceae bacterium]HMO91195.1 glycosyltransferase [Pirellulaceae bacterium]HMP69035.1 glycosyltransferase [Pirellulaceae bacterium]